MNTRIVKKEKIINSTHLMASFVIVVGIIFVLSKLHSFIMVSPDDIVFQSIISGSATGNPDGHVFFIRYPLSAALSILYKINGDISWYKLFLLASICLSMLLILTRLLSVVSKYRIRCFFTGILVVILLFSQDVIHLEWTVTAGILGSTAIFRFVTIPKIDSLLRKIEEYGICIFLFSLCYCLRNTVAKMYLPLAGICILYKLVVICAQKKNERNPKKTDELNSQLRSIVVFVFTCLLLIGIIYVVHNQAYKSEEWEDYKKYNKDRYIIFDYYGYPDFDNYKREYSLAGITREKYLLMNQDYNFVIPCDRFENINLELISKLSEYIGKGDVKKRLIEANEVIKDGIINENNFVYVIVIIVVILLSYVKCIIARTNTCIFVSSIIVWAGVLSLYLAYQGRFPDRVIRCIDYGIIMTLIGFLVSGLMYDSANCKNDIHLNLMMRIHSYLFIIILIVSNQLYLHEMNTQNQALAVSLSEVYDYCTNHPDNIYLRDFVSLSQKGELFKEKDNAPNYVSTGGWIYNSPIYEQIQENWGFYDFSEAIKNDNIYYLVNEKRCEGVVERIDNYFRSENIDAYVEVVDTFDTNYERIFVLKFVVSRD